MTALQPLLAQLSSGNDYLAENAAAKLYAHGQPAFAALCQLRQSPDPDQRWWAVRALSQFPASSGLNGELIAALEDDTVEVQQCAALAICHHPALQAVSSLIRLLSSSDSLLAGLASTALAKIGPEAVPALLEALKNEKASARLEAIRALAEIKDPRAIPALMKILDSDSALARYWAEQGLDNLGLGMVYLRPE